MSTQKETYIIELIDKNMSKGLKDIQQQIGKIKGQTDGMSKSGGIVSSLGRIASITAIAGGIGFLGKKIVGLGVDMEKTRVAFSTFLGDSDKANILIDQLNTFANVTPFNNAEIIKSGRLLLSAGIGANDIVKNLKMIGDVSAGANVPITELSAIFQKATNKGKLQAEELNQFAERGIPILDVLSKMYGKSKAEIMKMGSQGKITSDVMNKAFQKMTSDGGIFFNLMEKQSKTTGGKISTLVGKLQTLGIKIGEMLLPAISGLTDFAIAIVDNTELLKNIGIVVGLVSAGFLAYKIITLASSVATIGLSGVMATLNAVMLANPVGLVVAGITALVGIVYFAIKYFDDWGASLLLLMGPFGMIVNAIMIFKRNWEDIKKSFKDGGILAGLRKIGAVMLDTLLMPLQQLLTLASKIPGVGNLAGQGAQRIQALRDKIGVGENSKDSDYYTRGKIDGVTAKKTSLTNSNGSKPGGLPNLSTTKSGLKSGISEVKAGAPKVFNINIGSLIKEQNFETVKDVSQMKNIIRDEVSRILFGVVNDVQTT